MFYLVSRSRVLVFCHEPRDVDIVVDEVTIHHRFDSMHYTRNQYYLRCNWVLQRLGMALFRRRKFAEGSFSRLTCPLRKLTPYSTNGIGRYIRSETLQMTVGVGAASPI